MRHRACAECGKYRGKQVIDIVAKKEREQARAKRKEALAREMGAAPEKKEKKEKEESKKGE